MHNLENCTDLELKSWIKNSPPTYPRAVGGGLCISISETRITAWTFRYRHGGKQKELTIGRYPDISISEARKIALSLRNQVNEGMDVALEKKLAKMKQSSVETLNDAVERHLSSLGHLKHPDIPRKRYDKHVRLVLGGLPLNRISALHVFDLLQVIREGKTGITRPAPTVANDVLRFLTIVFDLAVTLGKIPFNPAGSLTKNYAGGQEHPRQRALDIEEIGKLFAAMNNTPNLGRENELAIKLLLVLCVRKNELMQAKWSEFNLEAKLWKLPGIRTKAGTPFRIPLPELAVEWLRELKVRAYQSDYVFPARRRQKNKLPHVSPDTLNAALKRVDHGLEHFVIHDLRRTARSHLGDLKVPAHVAEICLNHKLKGIQGIYDVFDYFSERKEALNKWAKEIEMIDHGNVISITKALKQRKA